MKYFSDDLMRARNENDADLLDSYRYIIRNSRDYIQNMIDIHGPDPAGNGLKILNEIDKIF